MGSFVVVTFDLEAAHIELLHLEAFPQGSYTSNTSL